MTFGLFITSAKDGGYVVCLARGGVATLQALGFTLFTGSCLPFSPLPSSPLPSLFCFTPLPLPSP